MSLRKVLATVVGMTFACGMGVVAVSGQETQPPSAGQDSAVRAQRQERMRERRERLGQRERLGEGLGGERRMRGHGGSGRFMRELNLTDEQRQQRQAIIQRRLESTKAQREELFRLGDKRRAGTFTPEDEARAKALHQELRSSMESIRGEMDAQVLTAEQKAKLEELKRERKQRMEQRLKERQERVNKQQL
jgi:periplasmic protein CpxP/Spy